MFLLWFVWIKIHVELNAFDSIHCFILILKTVSPQFWSILIYYCIITKISFKSICLQITSWALWYGSFFLSTQLWRKGVFSRLLETQTSLSLLLLFLKTIIISIEIMDKDPDWGHWVIFWWRLLLLRRLSRFYFSLLKVHHNSLNLAHKSRVVKHREKKSSHSKTTDTDSHPCVLPACKTRFCAHQADAHRPQNAARSFSHHHYYYYFCFTVTILL